MIWPGSWCNRNTNRQQHSFHSLNTTDVAVQCIRHLGITKQYNQRHFTFHLERPFMDSKTSSKLLRLLVSLSLIIIIIFLTVNSGIDLKLYNQLCFTYFTGVCYRTYLWNLTFKYTVVLLCYKISSKAKNNNNNNNNKQKKTPVVCLCTVLQAVSQKVRCRA